MKDLNASNSAFDDLKNEFDLVLDALTEIATDDKEVPASTAGTTDPPPPILSDPSIEAFVDYLQKHECRNIIVMTGAGISTSSGIPDFRSPDTGLYANLSKYNLPYPEAIFCMDYFKTNPSPFFTLATDIFPGNYKPTVAHAFINRLNDKNLLLRNYTQNIDTLERLTGLDDDKIIEAHGSFFSSTCTGIPFEKESKRQKQVFRLKECKRKYSMEWTKTEIKLQKIPLCMDCQSIVKPDITFFGENLPRRFYDSFEEDFEKCDALIVMGTSLSVFPFAGLIDRVPLHIPRLLINRERVGEFASGFDFDHKKETRDALYLGTCDDGCKKLAELMGWEEGFIL